MPTLENPVIIILALMKIKSRNKFIYAFLFVLTTFSALAQDANSDTLTFPSLNKSKWFFILEDTYLFGGVNASGIYYSNHFRNLSYQPGFIGGIEQYFPLKGRVFLGTGVNISQRNFAYAPSSPGIEVSSLYLDVPMTAAIELPVMRNLDFRLLLGANVGFRLHSNVLGAYEDVIQQHPDALVYQTNDFHTVDFGWHFGLSAEYKNLLFRLRSFSGFTKFDQKEQGMMSSFSVELGYFLFRGLKK